MITRSSLGALSAIGSAASLLCAVHCVLTPLIVAAVPLAGLARLSGGSTEGVLFGIAFVAVALGLGWGIRVHGRWGVLAGPGVALPLFLGSRFVDEGALERGLVVTGSMALAASLFWNHRSCRHCEQCREPGP